MKMLSLTSRACCHVLNWKGRTRVVGKYVRTQWYEEEEVRTLLGDPSPQRPRLKGHQNELQLSS